MNHGKSNRKGKIAINRILEKDSLLKLRNKKYNLLQERDKQYKN
jgi:hypothetical protein